MEDVSSLAVTWREQVGIKHRQGRGCSSGVKTLPRSKIRGDEGECLI